MLKFCSPRWLSFSMELCASISHMLWSQLKTKGQGSNDVCLTWNLREWCLQDSFEVTFCFYTSHTWRKEYVIYLFIQVVFFGLRFLFWSAYIQWLAERGIHIGVGWTNFYFVWHGSKVRISESIISTYFSIWSSLFWFCQF